MFSDKLTPTPLPASLEIALPTGLSHAPAPFDGPVPAPLGSSPPVESPPLAPPPSVRPHRVIQPSTRLRDFIVGSTTLSTYEPTSYREARSNPLWQHAMTDEL
ncbi:unnamed protein product [Camellia sinensis]